MLSVNTLGLSKKTAQFVRNEPVGSKDKVFIDAT